MINEQTLPMVYRRWQKKQKSDKPKYLQMGYFSEVFTGSLGSNLLKKETPRGRSKEVIAVDVNRTHITHATDVVPGSSQSASGVSCTLKEFLLLVRPKKLRAKDGLEDKASREAYVVADNILSDFGEEALFETFFAVGMLAGYQMVFGEEGMA